jgi:hypothetical protein
VGPGINQLASLIDLVLEFADTLIPQAKLALQVGDMENGKHTHHGRGDCRQARAPANATGARDCRGIARWRGFARPSRATALDSGPMWIATPLSQETCTLYSSPVSRRFAIGTCRKSIFQRQRQMALLIHNHYHLRDRIT